MQGRTATFSASSGVAIGKIKMANGSVQFTVVPGSASGTGTVTCVPEGTIAFEPVYDSAGAALTVDLSAQSSHIVPGRITHLKVTSDNSADTFDLVLAL